MTRFLYRFFLLSLATVSCSWAVDESRLWLPKKYQQAYPKLLAAARQAESSRRCQQVVRGEMIPRKNTDDAYYLVITCRDEKARTYSISYRFPIAGDTPAIVLEQASNDTNMPQSVAVLADGVNAEQAVFLCRKDFGEKAAYLEEVTILLDQLSPAVRRQDDFNLSMPFTALSDLGNPVLYRADCQVNQRGETRIDIALLEEGALTICRDQLNSESILLGRTTLLEDELQSLPATQGFHFQLPFNAKTLAGIAVRYLAECRVDASGESELQMTLQPEGAYAICTQALKMETLLMKAVTIAEQPLSEAHEDQGFSIEMGFEANDPEDNLRQFRAHCQVDKDGEALVTTELEESAIISVCKNGVIDEARHMLAVRVLDQQIPPLQEDDKGYLSIIPFDAKDPGGRPLHYQGECRVDETGRTRVQIKVRRN